MIRSLLAFLLLFVAGTAGAGRPLAPRKSSAATLAPLLAGSEDSRPFPRERRGF